MAALGGVARELHADNSASDIARMISVTGKSVRIRIGYLREITAGVVGPAGLAASRAVLGGGGRTTNGRIIS